jgi:hypothetical protein
MVSFAVTSLAEKHIEDIDTDHQTSSQIDQVEVSFNLSNSRHGIELIRIDASVRDGKNQVRNPDLID